MGLTLNYSIVTLKLFFLLASGHIGRAVSDDKGEFSFGATAGP